MNIYLVSQNQNNGYDTFDSFVCIARTAREAKHMAPRHKYKYDPKTKKWLDLGPQIIDWNCPQVSGWALSPKHVQVKRIGISIRKKTCVVCASFNAGETINNTTNEHYHH